MSLDSVRKSLLEAQGRIPCNDEDAHDRMRNSIEIVERIMLAEVRRVPIIVTTTAALLSR